MFCEGTIWHGPSFKNLAMPNDPEKTEITKVETDMLVLGISRKFFSTPKNISGFPKARAQIIKAVGTASTNGSEIKKVKICKLCSVV